LLSGTLVFSAEIPPYAALRAGTAFGMTLIGGVEISLYICGHPDI